MSVPLTRLRAVVAVVAMLLGLTTAAAVAATPAFASTGVTDTWTGNGPDNAWTDGANWSTGHAPNNGDSVYIAPPSKDHCSAHVDSVPDGVTLQDFTLTDAAPAAGFTCLASIDGGSISVAGAFTAHSGVLSTAFTLASGSTGTISPFTGFDTTTEFDADLTVHGVLTLDGNVPDGNNARDVTFGGAHSLTVASDGELDAKDSNVVSGTGCCVTQNHLTNNGLLKVEGGTLTITADELDQNGTLEADNSGVVTTTGSPDTAGDGATYTGTGTWQTQGAADTTFTGTQNLGSGFHLQLGGGSTSTDDETYDGNTTFAGSGTFDWVGGELATASLTIAHGVTANVRGNITGDHRSLVGQENSTPVPTIVNHGVLNFANAPTYYADSNGNISNASDGVLYLGAGTSVSGDCCSIAVPNEIANNGGRVAVPNTTSTTPVTLDNVSYVQTNGSTTIPANHSITLTGGGASSFSTATVNGGGLFALQAPANVTHTLNVGPTTTLQLGDSSDNYGELTSATSSPASVVGAGAVSWLGGSVGGTVSLATTGGVTVSGAKHTIEEYNGGPSSVTVKAPATFTSGTAKVPNEIDFVDSGRLTLAGATSVASAVTLFSGHVINTGTLTVTSAANYPFYLDSSDLTNRGTVTIYGTLKSDNNYYQVAGTTNVLGTLAIAGSSASVRISGGVFGGKGHVSGSVVNSAGQVQPGLGQYGTLAISGNYSQAAAASMLLQVGSSSVDQVTVGGATVIRGQLAFVNVGAPKLGDQHTVLTGASRPSVLPSCVTTTGPGSTSQHWSPSVSGNSLVITSVAGQQSSCPAA